jgi:hypothetical protein
VSDRRSLANGNVSGGRNRFFRYLEKPSLVKHLLSTSYDSISGESRAAGQGRGSIRGEKLRCRCGTLV